MSQLLLQSVSDRVINNPGSFADEATYTMEVRDCNNVTIRGGVFDATLGAYGGTDAGIIATSWGCTFENCVFIGSGNNDRQCLLIFQGGGHTLRNCRFLIPAPLTANTQNWGKRGIAVQSDFNVIEDCEVAFEVPQYGPGWPGSSDGNSSGITVYGGFFNEYIKPRGNILVGNRVYGATAYGIGLSNGRNDTDKVEALCSGTTFAENRVYCHKDAYACYYSVAYKDNGDSQNYFKGNVGHSAEYCMRNRGGWMIVDGAEWYPERVTYGNAVFNDLTNADYQGTLDSSNVNTNAANVQADTPWPINFRGA